MARRASPTRPRQRRRSTKTAAASLRLAQRAVHEGEALADREGELVGERHALGLGGGEGGEEPVAAGEERLRLRPEPAVAHLEVAGGATLREGGEEAPGGFPGRAPQDAAEDAVQVGGAPVVVAHEQLRGEQAPAVLVAEAPRHRGLQVQGEHVRLAAGDEVGLRAHAEQEVVGAQRRLVLPLGEKARGAGVGEAAAAVAGLGHPEHRVQVAQAADALLDVRLLDAHRPADPGVAFGHVRAERLEKGLARLAVATDGVVEGPVERPEDRRVAGHEAGLGEGGARVEVAAGLLEALGQGPEAVADGEADVPEELEDLLDEPSHGLRRHGPGAGRGGPRRRTGRAPPARSRRGRPPRTRRAPAAPAASASASASRQAWATTWSTW